MPQFNITCSFINIWFVLEEYLIWLEKEDTNIVRG